jgi:hypothetical protein
MFDQKLNARWTKDPMRCQYVEILKVYQILMYKILCVGTHAIHFVVFSKLIIILVFFYKQHYVYLFFARYAQRLMTL